MVWEKLPVWTGKVHLGCLNCTPVPDNTPLCCLDRILAVGFGDVTVIKDGETVYSEMAWMQEHDPVDWDALEEQEALGAAMGVELEPTALWDEGGDYPTLATYEAMAAADPDHDWRVRFWGMLHEEEYQRQGPEAWVLVRSGEGFA